MVGVQHLLQTNAKRCAVQPSVVLCYKQPHSNAKGRGMAAWVYDTYWQSSNVYKHALWAVPSVTWICLTQHLCTPLHADAWRWAACLAAHAVKEGA